MSSSIINHELHDAYMNYIKKAGQKLSSPLSNLNDMRKLHYEKRLKNEPYKAGEGHQDLNIEETLNDAFIIDKFVNYLIEAEEDLLKSIPEYGLCVKAMNNDERISKQVNKYHRIFGMVQHITHWTYISHILSRLLSEYIIANEFNIDLFKRLYSDLENFLYNDNVLLAEIAPLHFFALTNPASSIDLTGNLSIKKINGLERFLTRTPTSYDLKHYFLSKVSYAIEYKLEIPKGFDIDYETQMKYYPSNMDSIFAAVISALRLFQNGSVGTSSFLQVILLDLPIGGPKTTGLDFLGLEADSIGATYILDQNQIENFKEFWNDYHQLLIKILDFKITKKDKLQNIKVALNRFNYGHQKRNSEDRVLDHVISLESLLSKQDDPTDSITYKLALRSARFVSQNPDEMERLYCKIKDLYSLRSKIVHGSFYESVGFDIHDHIRKCLRLYLSKLKAGQDHESIINSIDFAK